MRPIRAHSFAALNAPSSPNAHSEVENTASSFLRSLFGSTSFESGSSSSASSRKKRKLPPMAVRYRSLSEVAARRRRSVEASRKDRPGGGGEMRRARTWNLSLPLVPSPPAAPAPALPLFPLPADSSTPLANRLINPAVDSPFNCLASSSDSESSTLDASTPEPSLARPPLPAPPPAPQNPPPSKSNIRLVHVQVPEFIPPDDLHLPATERSKTRLRAMLQREKEYREELRQLDGNVGPGRRRDAESRCEVELEEFEREVKHLLQAVPHPSIDQALSYHLSICLDSRFLSILLFSRLVSLAVFPAAERREGEKTRKASIREASLTCLLLACKTNHDSTGPLSPIGLRGLAWLLMKDDFPYLIQLEKSTLRTIGYRTHPPTFHALLSEMRSSLRTLQDALDHLSPDTWTILEDSALEDLKTILLSFEFTTFAPSLLVCALVWRDLREVMQGQLSVEEARETAEEVREEMRATMGFEQEEWKAVRVWIGEVLTWG